MRAGTLGPPRACSVRGAVRACATPLAGRGGHVHFHTYRHAFALWSLGLANRSRSRTEAWVRYERMDGVWMDGVIAWVTVSGHVHSYILGMHIHTYIEQAVDTDTQTHTQRTCTHIHTSLHTPADEPQARKR